MHRVIGAADRPGVYAKLATQVGAKALGFPRSQAKFDLEGQLPGPPRLAVVGSRGALLRDREGVERVVEIAGEGGWSLVSGGALGVDGWMHRAALQRALPQLAVLPSAQGTYYPPAHAELFDAIAGTGNSGLLFALARGREPARHVFVARNEIVLRCASAVVVAHSRLRSGSLWTGQRALALSLPTAVFADSPGSDRLIAQGAVNLGPAKGADFAQRVRAFLAGQPIKLHPAWPEHLAELGNAFAQVPDRALGVEEFPDPLLAAAQLGEAAALGLVIELGPGQYRLISS